MPPPAQALPARLVDAVLSGDGLDVLTELAAEAIGGSVAIVLPAYAVASTSAGATGRVDAARRFVTARMKGQPGALPPGFLADAVVSSGDDELGAVLLLDDGRAPAPTAAGILRLVAVAALSVVALQGTAGSGPRAAEALLVDLARGELDAHAVLTRAGRIGVDLADGAVALRAHARPEQALRAARVIADEEPDALLARRGSELDALLPGDRAATEPRAAALARRLARYADVGVSVHEPSVGRLHRAFREAELALRLARSGDATGDETADGTWRLLFRLAVTDLAALRRLRDTTLGAVLEHDGEHATELLVTLRCYLRNGANMNATAAALPAHRHTVAYRLDKLRALTGLDATRSDERERLSLALKAQAVLDAQARSAR